MMSARVLIADDHAVVRAGLRQMLADDNSVGEIGEASTGQQTLERLRENPWELLILDIGMPGLNGYDLARRLHDPERPRVLVAVTGWGQPEDHRRTAEAGFDHHLVKPPDLEVLREICANAPARPGALE